MTDRSTADPTGSGPSRLGVFGLLDRGRFGEGLALRIFAEEMAERRPWAEVQGYSPSGDAPPSRRAGRWPVRPLGVWSLARARELADQLDIVAVTGDLVLGAPGALGSAHGGSPGPPLARGSTSFLVEGLGPQLERRRPVVWHCVGTRGDPDPDEANRLRRALAGRAHVAVRDELVRLLLERIGVERDVAVVPDPLLLLPRRLGESERRRRLDLLRLGGLYPGGDAPLVVEADPDSRVVVEDLASAIEAARASLGVPAVVVVSASSDEAGEAMSAALTNQLGEPAHRVPTTASEEEVATAIAAASAVVSASPAGLATALAFGRPAVALALHDGAHLEGLANLAGAREAVVHDLSELPRRLARAVEAPVPEAVRIGLTRRVRDHLDRLSDLAEQARWSRRLGVPFAGAGTPAGAEPAADARRAFEERERALLEQRAMDQERLQQLTEEAKRLREQVDQLERRCGHQELELARANGQADNLTWEVFHRDASLGRFQTNQQTLVAEAHRLATELAQRDAAATAAAAEVERLAAALARARAELNTLVRSNSWRATAPLRFAARHLRQDG